MGENGEKWGEMGGNGGKWEKDIGKMGGNGKNVESQPADTKPLCAKPLCGLWTTFSRMQRTLLLKGGGGALRREIFAMGYFEAGLFCMQS